MIICCVPLCQTKGARVFHSFPKNQLTCQKWISKTKCYKLNKKTAYASYSKVCKHHFRDDDYLFPGSRFLRKGTVPSLFLPGDLNIGLEHNYNESKIVNFPVAITAGEDEVPVPMVYINENIVPSLSDFVEENQIHMAVNLDENNVPTLVDLVEDKQNDDNGTVQCENINMEQNEQFETAQQSHFLRPDRKKRIYNPLKRKLRYQSARIAFVTKKLRNLEPDNSTFFKYISSKLSEEQVHFLRMQIRNAGRKKRGNRFTFEDKCLAVAIYKQGPKCYRFLARIFNLPSKQTLYRHTAKIRFETGINKNLMKYIADAAGKLKEIDKIVTVAFDEMSVTTHLDYSNICDYIDGFEDLASKRTSKFATHALVFMLRGIHKAFKQPFAYFCTSDLKSGDLAELIKLVIEAVTDTGLNVVGSVCDATNTNAAAINILRELSNKPSAGHLLQYKIRNSIITHVFDPPHLLKSVRNNLLTKNLRHYVARNVTKNESEDENYMRKWNLNNSTEKVASWTDVSEFYDYNKKGVVNRLQNINDEHIKPESRTKMKVDKAAQICSATYGNTMYFCSERNQLDRDFTGTADIILFFNDVFESVNGGGDVAKSSYNLKGSINKDSFHFKFWDYAIEMLKKMKYVWADPSTSERSRVLADWITTIKGLRVVTYQLLRFYNFEKVSLRRTTQDALENFFGSIRGYCQSRRTITIRQFRNSYAISIFNNVTSRHSVKSNCKDDKEKPMLRNLYSLFAIWEELENQPVTPTTNENDENESGMSDKENEEIEFLEAELLSVPENEAKNFVSGFLCKKFLKVIACSDCQKTVQESAESTRHDFLRKLQTKTTTGILLAYPSQSFINAVKIISFKLEHLIPNVCSLSNLKKELITGIEFEDLFLGCNVHKVAATEKFKDLAIGYFVYVFNTRINNILSRKISQVNCNDKIQVAAFKKK